MALKPAYPRSFYEKFNLTGTSHVIVISGSNVALVTGVMMGFGIWLFGRRGALWPTLGGLALYTLLVGADAAVMRAALMGGLFVVATVLGRQGTALVSLAAACWLMTLWNPLMLWDVGFQLSRAATVGLILMGPALLESFRALWNMVGKGLRRWGAFPNSSVSDFLSPTSAGDLLRDALLTTMAASIATYPLIVFYFGRLSLISLLSNLLIAPAQPGILIFGGIALIVGLSGLEQLAQLLLFIPYAGLWWTTTVVIWSASFQGASVEVEWFGGGAGGYHIRRHSRIVLAKSDLRLRQAVVVQDGANFRPASRWCVDRETAGRHSDRDADMDVWRLVGRCRDAVVDCHDAARRPASCALS